MHVDAGDLDAGQLRGLIIEPRRLEEGDAELVFRSAGRDLGVGLGVHVRVDTNGNTGGLLKPGGDLAQHIEFGLALDVEAEDSFRDRIGYLLPGFAHASEDYPI